MSGRHRGKNPKPKLEFRSIKRNGWYEVYSVKLVGNTLTVRFVGDDNCPELDEKFNVFQNEDEIGVFLNKFRPKSSCVEDCQSLEFGMVVSAISETDNKKHNGTLELIDRRRHMTHHPCECKFEIKWLEGPKPGENQILTGTQNMFIINKGDPLSLDLVLQSFVQKCESCTCTRIVRTTMERAIKEIMPSVVNATVTLVQAIQATEGLVLEDGAKESAVVRRIIALLAEASALTYKDTLLSCIKTILSSNEFEEAVQKSKDRDFSLACVTIENAAIKKYMRSKDLIQALQDSMEDNIDSIYTVISNAAIEKVYQYFDEELARQREVGASSSMPCSYSIASTQLPHSPIEAPTKSLRTIVQKHLDQQMMLVQDLKKIWDTKEVDLPQFQVQSYGEQIESELQKVAHIARAEWRLGKENEKLVREIQELEIKKKKSGIELHEEQCPVTPMPRRSPSIYTEQSEKKANYPFSEPTVRTSTVLLEKGREQRTQGRRR